MLIGVVEIDYTEFHVGNTESLSKRNTILIISSCCIYTLYCA
jgi:hypothetical protein